MAKQLLVSPTIHIGTHDRGPLVTLRKTSQGEMEALWPVHPATIHNMTEADKAEIGRPAAAIIAELDASPDVDLWGIHAGEGSEERLVGFATLGPRESKWRDVGIAVLDPTAQGMGIGPRVILGIAVCAFDRMGCELLYADPLEANYASMRIFEENGFIRRDRGAAVMRIQPQNWRTQWVLPGSVEGALGAVPILNVDAAAGAIATHNALRQTIGVSVED